VGIVLRAQAGRAGVTPSMGQGRLVEQIDHRPPAGGEGDVHTVAGRRGLAVQGRFDTEQEPAEPLSKRIPRTGKMAS
jgi:hypothetical protein